VENRRKARNILTIAMVLAMHLAAVWLLASSHRFVKTQSESFQVFSIVRPRVPESAPKPDATPPRSASAAPKRRTEQTAPPSVAARPKEEDNAIHPGPDWNDELKIAAQDTLANELAQKRHDTDFAHPFPTQPGKAPEFAWNNAAIHPVETIPQGGILIHLGDHCVLLLFPLPMVGCGFGKPPANGDLFKH
jgi:hypothetical protein